MDNLNASDSDKSDVNKNLDDRRSEATSKETTEDLDEVDEETITDTGHDAPLSPDGSFDEPGK